MECNLGSDAKNRNKLIYCVLIRQLINVIIIFGFNVLSYERDLV
jgi:hypothetical protein